MSAIRGFAFATSASARIKTVNDELPEKATVDVVDDLRGASRAPNGLPEREWRASFPRNEEMERKWRESRKLRKLQEEEIEVYFLSILEVNRRKCFFFNSQRESTAPKAPRNHQRKCWSDRMDIRR